MKNKQIRKGINEQKKMIQEEAQATESDYETYSRIL